MNAEPNGKKDFPNSSPERLAIIDLGTNTFNILIAQVSENDFQRLYSEEIPVKLGEKGINKGVITPEAWKRGISAMQYINRKISYYQCTRVNAIATSAIRSASNGGQFTKAVKETTGIDIEVIDGNTEARLIYEGVKRAVSLHETALIVDIGGGSVEFIICDHDTLFWQASFPIGAARLSEAFHHSDPISKGDTEQIEKHLEQSLSELFTQCRIYNPRMLVGSAGAFESFAEIISLKYGIPFTKEATEFIFDIRQFHELMAEIIASNRSARENLPGLVQFRVDMIVPATVLTRYVLGRTEISSVKLSVYALKEGAAEKLYKMQ